MKANVYAYVFKTIVNNMKAIKADKNENDKIYFTFNDRVLNITRTIGESTDHTSYQTWEITSITDHKPMDYDACLFCNTKEVLPVLKKFTKSSDFISVSFSGNIIRFDNLTTKEFTTLDTLESSSSESPILPDENYQIINIPVKGLKAVYKHCSDGKEYIARQALKGVHIKIENSTITMEGCDAHRASIYSLTDARLKDVKADIVMPKAAVMLALESPREWQTVEYSLDYCKIDGSVIYVNSLYQYPNLKNIIPQHCNSELSVDLAELERALKNLKGTTNKATDGVKVEAGSIASERSGACLSSARAENWQPISLKRSSLLDFIQSIKTFADAAKIYLHKDIKSNCVKITTDSASNYTGVLARTME